MNITTKQLASLKALQINTWKWDYSTSELVETTVKPTVYLWDNGEVVISAEDGHGTIDFDSDTIAQELKDWMVDNSVDYEWYDMGTMSLYTNN